MTKTPKQNSYDRRLNWLKNKFAVIILLAAAVIAFGSVTDSIDKIYGFFHKYFTSKPQVAETGTAQPNPPVRKLSSPANFNKTYISTASSGRVVFDYSNNNGLFIIGESPYFFKTKWSKASDRSIHVYNDPPSIVGVALAKGVSDVSKISDAATFDMSSRTRTPQENEYVILKNVNGYFAVLQIVEVKDRTALVQLNRCRNR
ncbi:hypothetical protein DSCO28_01850 [Desulfosarcina ovata subsp. sediminis]|uniref:Uncharacterized protein n=1 Tax=Desulfosarcina ovata subsp. sediminis TaxID=885957 RepID=A0A5K7ZIQ1_9BACT|nr:hypothetical protein [Desulfosarcina ovata]BBO79619.1 hypothetical protein DSCO28_01850 [Desulfosarcina ovata subsp. sediminis]